MSKTLGPIHYMMYEKIKFQDKITEYLMDGDFKDIEYEPVSTKPLDEILDQDNIHGFLQEKVDIVETRLAQALRLSNDTDDKLFKLGKSLSEGKNLDTFDDIFNDLNIYLLDGMPCDRGLSAGIEGDSLYLITENNLHSKYDEEINLAESKDATCGGDHDHDHHDAFELSDKIDLSNTKEESSYHKHRLALLKGYLSNTAYDVELINGVNYRIYKK